MPDNKNEITPKDIKLIKKAMRCNLGLCISGYTLALLLLICSVKRMASQEWGLATFYALMGYWDCRSGDACRKRYKTIHNALKIYKELQQRQK